MRGTVKIAALAGVLAALPHRAVHPAAIPSGPPATAALLAAYRPPKTPLGDAPPATQAQRDLGRLLFFDPLLSANQTQSCATCHNPGLSWAAGIGQAIGSGARAMKLRAPTLIDTADLPLLGWDGKYATIESVTFAAVSGAHNMNLPVADALARLRANAGYAAEFDAAFPGAGISRRTVEAALAGYERTIVSGEAPFDRWVAGDEAAVSASAKRGFLLFNGPANCSQCHSGWTFTDGSFHDIGTATGADIGRQALFPTSRKLKYAFKTPTLRDVARRAPYMHDGSVPTLDGVLDLYDRGGIARPSRSELIHRLGLSAADRADLLAFLRTLTETPAAVVVPVLPR